MSDTRRYVQRSWMKPHTVDLLYTVFESVKHWAGDRPPWGRKTHSRGKFARRLPFSKYGRNSKYNLERKNEGLALRENLEELPE